MMLPLVSNVLQESRITVSAAVPPIAQNSFSRLPCSHFIGLRSRTRCEYYQKPELPTTHLFGKSAGDEILGEVGNYQRLRRFDCVARYALGDVLESLLNTRLNCESD